jgi:4-amino-4-deoxy-L-arabinose transferase-like glycosyltransferase
LLLAIPRPVAVRISAAVRLEVLVVLAILAILAANLPYLEAWPTAHNDEAREMNAFWVASGADPSARSMDPEFGRDPLYKGGLQGLTVGAVFRLAGPGLLQGRLVSLAWGGVLLGLVFLVGRRLYGATAGLLAALFLAVAYPFLVASHMVRPDIVLAAMLAASYYLASRAVEGGGHPLPSLLAGLTLGLALDVHLNAIAFMPLIGLVYVAGLARWWRARVVWMFALGLVLGAVYYLLIRVAPDAGQFAASSSYWIGLDKRPPILSGDLPGMLTAELGRFQGYFTSARRFELAALSAALVLATVRMVRTRRLDPLLLGLVVAFALFVTIVSGKSEFYLVLFYPWLVLLLAGAIVQATSSLPTPLRVMVLVLAAAAGPSLFGLDDNYEDMEVASSDFGERGYYALIDEVRPLVPDGASVLGPPLFWIGLHDHPYTDYYVWERLRAERGEKFSSFVARLRPELAVLDAKSRHQVSINSPGYLEANGELLKTIRRVGFDRVEVWKLY